MESTAYAYMHLSAHMETPEFRWFNLLLYPTSIIWQNICTQQSSLLACLLGSDRILEFGVLQALRRTQSAYQEDWVLHNMQHSTFLFGVFQKELLAFYVLTGLSLHRNSLSNYISSILHKNNLSLYSLICLFEVVKSRIRSCMHTSGMRQHSLLFGESDYS